MIIVYSKEGCDRCERLKAHLEKMGVEYEVRDLASKVEWHEGWREDNSIDLLAYLCTIHPNKHLPTIGKDGEYYDYTSGMKEIKRGKQV